MTYLRKLYSFIGPYYKNIYIVAIILVLLISVILLNYITIGRYQKFVINQSPSKSNEPLVGIVLGGGIENGKPKPLLQDRLDAAASLAQAGRVHKLVVSGDNRFSHYNEPEAMRNYLIEEKGIYPEQILNDYAGRSTYETCERAKKIFGLHKAILISESTHLPRAIYLCRSFGIEAYGYRSDGQSSAGLRAGQRFREVMARTKASINIYLIGERTVLGESIKI